MIVLDAKFHLEFYLTNNLFLFLDLFSFLNPKRFVGFILGEISIIFLDNFFHIQISLTYSILLIHNTFLTHDLQ